jgi:hypothetical protein
MSERLRFRLVDTPKALFLLPQEAKVLAESLLVPPYAHFGASLKALKIALPELN